MDKTNRAMALIAVRKQNKEYADELLAQYKTGTHEDVEFLDEVLSMSLTESAAQIAPSVVVADLPLSVQPLAEAQAVPEQMILIGESPVLKTRQPRCSFLQKPTVYQFALQEAEKVALRKSRQNPLLTLSPELVLSEPAEDTFEVFSYYGIDFALDVWVDSGIRSDRRRLPYELKKFEITPALVGTRAIPAAVRCAGLVLMRLWSFCEARFASEGPGKCSRRSMSRILLDLVDSQVDVDGSTVRRIGYVRSEHALTFAGGLLNRKQHELRLIQHDLAKYPI